MRSPKTFKQHLLIAGFALCAITCVQAQEDVIEKTPYYININTRSVNDVQELHDYLLSLEYNDRYGQWKNIAFKVYNWKREVVASLSMDKAFGLNRYNIALDQLYSGWELNQVYIGEIKDEAGNRHQVAIRPVEAPKTIPPAVTIVVNPLQLQCDGTSPSSVEFVGDVQGGKTPYRIQWAVLNNDRTSLLYQPLEEIIKVVGLTSAISVNKSPDYHVLLQVKDACDNIVRREVHLVCDQETKKINTVFVEPLKSLPPPTDN